MLSLAANLTLLFREYPFADRYTAAANAGFRGVECLFPYECPAEVLATRLGDHGLTQALFNAPAGYWEAGERGIACHPDRTDEFRRGLDRAIHYAEVLDCPRIHCLAGVLPDDVSRSEAWDALVSNMDWAATQLGSVGRTLMIEPINSRIDMPGYLVDRVSVARQLMTEINRPNAQLQFDLYHAAIMEPDLHTSLVSQLPVTGHIQFADYPGRHEPGSGTLPLADLFRTLDQAGYRGWVGAEYHPRKSTMESLGTLAPWLLQ